MRALILLDPDGVVAALDGPQAASWPWLPAVGDALPQRLVGDTPFGAAGVALREGLLAVLERRRPSYELRTQADGNGALQVRVQALEGQRGGALMTVTLPGAAEAAEPETMHAGSAATGVAPTGVTPDDGALMQALRGTPGIDPDAGLAAVGGSMPVYRRLLGMFVCSHDHDAAGIVALVEGGDEERARAVAHRLRGGAATLGLVDVEQAAMAVERPDTSAPASERRAGAARLHAALGAAITALRTALR